MKLTRWLLLASGVTGFALLSASAQAAPVGAGADLRIVAGENSGVEKVHGYYRDRHYYPRYRYYRHHHHDYYPRYRYYRYHHHHHHRHHWRHRHW